MRRATCSQASYEIVKLDPAIVGQLRELGGEALVRQLFRTFLDHAPTRLASLRSAVETDDLEELTRAVHSLRSSSAMLGAMELSELAGRLETLADAGERKRLTAGIPELEGRVAELVAVLERELERPAGSAG